MISDTHVLWVVVTFSAVTFGLRTDPLIVMDYLSDNRYLEYIGRKCL